VLLEARSANWNSISTGPGLKETPASSSEWPELRLGVSVPMHSIPGLPLVLDRSKRASLAAMCGMLPSPWIQPQTKGIPLLPRNRLELWITHRLFLLDDWSAPARTFVVARAGQVAADAVFELRSVRSGMPCPN